MKWIILLVLFCVVKLSFGQYYYNDIITAKQTIDKYLLLKKNNIREVIATSYEADGTQTADFTLTQQINSGATEITTTTDFPSTGMSVSIATYSNNQIVKTADSTGNIKKTTTYTYSNGLLSSVKTEINDVFMNNSTIEIHQYFYENNVPVKMLLIKNNSDTTLVNFISDEQQNVAEEHWIRQNKTIEKYFYYYNANHQLTDIVRFNLKANRMLPDFLFDYDNAGQVKQMTQVPQGSDDYIIWVYEYNNTGLKQKELCYNKQRQPVGRIEYKYK